MYNAKNSTNYTVSKYIEMISKDYQLNKKDERYCGFLNVQPNDAGPWTEAATKLALYPSVYQHVLSKFELAIEPNPNEWELIFVNKIQKLF